MPSVGLPLFYLGGRNQMTVAKWIFSHPSLYWLLALLVSAYYGFRGCVYQTVDMRDSWKKAPTWKKVVVWYIQDTIYNFVCSRTWVSGLHY